MLKSSIRPYEVYAFDLFMNQFDELLNKEKSTFIDIIPNLYSFEKQILKEGSNHDPNLNMKLFSAIYTKFHLSFIIINPKNNEQ